MKLGIFFICLLLLAAAVPPSFSEALFFVVAFYLLMGIKELIFIERGNAYHLLLLCILFITLLHFFAYFYDFVSFVSMFSIALITATFFILARRIFSFQHDSPELSPRYHFAFSLAAFLCIQLAFVIFILPLSFLYQTAILYLGFVVLLELILLYSRQRLERPYITLILSGAFVVLVVILTSASWQL